MLARWLEFRLSLLGSLLTIFRLYIKYEQVTCHRWGKCIDKLGSVSFTGEHLVYTCLLVPLLHSNFKHFKLHPKNCMTWDWEQDYNPVQSVWCSPASPLALYAPSYTHPSNMPRSTVRFLTSHLWALQPGYSTCLRSRN